MLAGCPSCMLLGSADLELTLPTEVMETAGAGVRGCVNGRSTPRGRLGGPTWSMARPECRPGCATSSDVPPIEGTTNVYVSARRSK